MKKKLTNNLGLKIGSIILAIIVWFLVVNASDPVRTQVFTDIPITVTNSSYLESMGLSYQLSEQSGVRVVIRDNASVVKNIRSEDIKVVADMTQIVNIDSDPVLVPLRASCSKYPNIDVDNITTTPGNAQISLEKLASEEFVITASQGDTKPDLEYEVGDMQVSPETLTISGPQSIINKIDKVVAQVDVTDLAEDKDLSGKLSVIDKNQEALSEYQMNYLTLQNIEAEGTVSVHVTLWKIRTDVSIKASAAGTPAKGYQIAEVDTTPGTITVAGTQEALASLQEAGNVIEIPESEVDADGKKDDFETKIDISGFLPDGIRLATDVSSSVMIKTTILPYGSKAIEVPSTNITQTGLGEDLRAVFDSDRIQVRVQGTDSALEALTASDITGTVDLSQLTAGTSQSVPVQITLPSGLELVSDVKANITISNTETIATVTKTNTAATGTNEDIAALKSK